MCEHCKYEDNHIGDHPCDTCGDDKEWDNFVPSVEVMKQLIDFVL